MPALHRSLIIRYELFLRQVVFCQSVFENTVSKETSLLFETFSRNPFDPKYPVIKFRTQENPPAAAGRARGWEPLSLDIQPRSNQEAGRTLLVGLWTDKRRPRTHRPCLIPFASSLLQTGTASPTRAVAWAANTDSLDATTMYPSRYHDHRLLFVFLLA